MVSFLPPDLSITFLVALLVPLILGFIVGIIIKSVLKIGIAIAIIIMILIGLGIVAPSTFLNPLASLIKSGAGSSGLTQEIGRLAGYLPYTSITFIIGLAIGFFKG